MKLTDNMGISGVFKTIINEDYHSRKEFISRSALIDFDKSPYTYWAKHINPDRPIRESTPAMHLGSAVHTFILEPKTFHQYYDIEPPKIFLKHSGRELYEAYKNKIEQLEQSAK